MLLFLLNLSFLGSWLHMGPYKAVSQVWEPSCTDVYSACAMVKLVGLDYPWLKLVDSHPCD